MTDTALVLSSMGVPIYSARGLTQTLAPIQGAFDLRRDVNGILVDLSQSKFRKFTSKISCSDVNAPALDGITVGMVLTVSCVCELSCSGTPSRSVASSRSEGGYTFYRPQLTMMVTGFDTSVDEWSGLTTWTLSLEEV